MAVTLTIHVNDRFAQLLQALAKDMERSLEELVVMALEDFYASEREATDATLAGLGDIESGRTVPHEAVMAWAQSIGTDHRLPRPQAKPAIRRAS